MAKILIVEDAHESSKALSTLFQQEGHEVTCVSNGRDALSQVLADLPDVMLLDLMLPEMDGPSFLEVTRSYLRIGSLPVVVLTALEESPMIERARALNLNAILLKGKVTPEDILNAVVEAVGHYPG